MQMNMIMIQFNEAMSDYKAESEEYSNKHNINPEDI